MNTLKCIVVDDDQVQRELISGFVRGTDSLEITSEFDNPLDARNFLESNAVDIVFLDIEMPVMSGLELIASIEKVPRFILMSSKEKYALESYNYDVIDYMLKPVSYARFLQAVDKVKGTFQAPIGESAEEEVNEIFVKVDGMIEKLTLTDIQRIEAAVDYVQFYTTNGKFLVNGSMNAMEEKLPQKDFVRVHRSHIVRIDQISKIDGRTLLIDNATIPISKSYKPEVMKRITIV